MLPKYRRHYAHVEPDEAAAYVEGKSQNREQCYAAVNGRAFRHCFFEHACKADTRKRQNVVKQKLRNRKEVRSLNELKQTVNHAYDKSFADTENIAVDKQRQRACKRNASAV